MSDYPDPMTKFKIGQELTVSKVRENYRGSNGKGIVKGADNDYVFLFSTQKEHKDVWSKDYDFIFLYHGAGDKKGPDGRYLDQDYSDGKQGNKYILEAFIRGNPVYLIMDEGGKKIIKGPMMVAFEPFMEHVDDRNKLVFPLIEPSIYKSLSLDKMEEIRATFTHNLTKEEFESTASITIPASIKKVERTTNHYVRNPVLKELALRRANGICQLCDEPGPFKLGDRFFLEAHHVIPLKDGGPDSLDNIAGLCPNCHRKVHLKNVPAYTEKLKKACQ